MLNGKSSSCRLSETAEHVPVVRNLQLRDVSILEQLNIVRGVCVAPPEDAVTPGGDAGLARGIIHITPRVKLEGRGKRQLTLLVPLHMRHIA